MTEDLLTCHKSATISGCGKYRYELRRVWDLKKPQVVWIMLNPSTADANQDDPTIRKVYGFSKRWGAGGFTVVNLFAYRATDPRELKTAEDPFGPLNTDFVRSHLYSMSRVVLAWGAAAQVPPLLLKEAKDRIGYLLFERDGDVLCLGRTTSRDPLHPLMVSYENKFVPFRMTLKEQRQQFREKQAVTEEG